MIKQYTAESDVTVRRPAMIHYWDELTFLHWKFDPELVQRLLPKGLYVEPRDGAAWVGLVPFFIKVGLPHVSSIPWMSRFPETNVRTYVHDEQGRTGIWFFSLDAARLGAVLTARATYRLPYFWSQMSIEHGDSSITYDCRRRWPGPHNARSHVKVNIGEPFAPTELTEFDHFLTARWALYSAPAMGLRRAEAFHAPWPLRRAEVVDLHDELVGAAGLPTPTEAPLAHYSPSVEVRIGWPHPLHP